MMFRAKSLLAIRGTLSSANDAPRLRAAANFPFLLVLAALALFPVAVRAQQDPGATDRDQGTPTGLQERRGGTEKDANPDDQDRDKSSGTAENSESSAGQADNSSSLDRGDPANASVKRMKPATLRLPTQLAEIVRLAMSGTSDDDLIARINEQRPSYTLTPEQVDYLRDLGISDRVVNTISGSGVAATNRPDSTSSGNSVAPVDENDRDLYRDRDTNRVPRQASTYAEQPYGGASYAAPPYYQQNNSSSSYAEGGYIGNGGRYGSFTMFDGALSPYGNWLDMPGYGLCWQPLVGRVNRNWMPYGSNGQWVSTDAGWYWKSGYSWGWAPFHYGRWFNSNAYGWMWQPDSQWGPAWVSWRKAPNHAGWAPLPPGATFDTSGKGWLYRGRPVGPRYDFGLTSSAYMFVPFAQFTRKFQSSPYAPATLVKPQIFDQSMVYNDLIVGPNRVIINRGVEPRMVQLATGVPIVPVPVKEVAENRGGRGHRGDDHLPPTGWDRGDRRGEGGGRDGHGGNDQDNDKPGHPGQPGGTPNPPPKPAPYGGGKSIPQRGPMNGYQEESGVGNWVPNNGGYVSPRGWTPPGFDPTAGRNQTPGNAASRTAPGVTPRGVPAAPGRIPAGVPTVPGTAPIAPGAPVAPTAPAVNGGGIAPAGAAPTGGGGGGAR